MATSIIISGDIMPVDHLCFCYKEADPPHKYIMAKSSLHCACYVYLSWDYNIKKFSGTELKKIQRARVYLNNELLFAETLMDLAVVDI